MRLRGRAISVRMSLALWYIAAMIVVLALYAAIVYAFVNRSVSTALDDRLRDDFQWANEMAEQRPDGTLTWFDGDTGDGQDSPWLQVWSPAGQLLFKTMAAERSPLAESERLALRADDQIVSVATLWTAVRVLSGRSMIGGKPVVIQVARSEAPMRSNLRDLRFVLMVGLPLGVAVAGVGGYTLARRALAPVDRMADRARSITADRLSNRLPIDNPNDELGRLASVFNDTLGRLESSFDRMRQFTADVSHEVRTPLTAIRAVGEVGLQERRDEASYRGVIASMLEEADRLSSLVDRLLMLSRAETGLAKAAIETVDLSDLAQEVAAQLAVLAEEKSQTVTVEPAGRPEWRADRTALRQCLINLLDNAIKHTPVGGEIRIRVADSLGSAHIEVSDTGPGIPPELQARIFDRFYRGSREPGAAGAGLGLAIAKQAVEANGGRLMVVSAGTSGSTFRITLPYARQQASG
jgi:heavy metal sensor kinase